MAIWNQMLLRTLLTLSLLIFRLHCRLGSILLAEQVPVHGVVHGAPREQRIQRYLQQVSTSSFNFCFYLILLHCPLQAYSARLQEAQRLHWPGYRERRQQGRGPVWQSRGEGQGLCRGAAAQQERLNGPVIVKSVFTTFLLKLTSNFWILPVVIFNAACC